MSKMDICTCAITLSGDGRTVVVRGPTNPMTYPEVNLMMFTHGDRYVSDIKVIKTVDTDNATELQNLRIKYGKAMKEAFPGQRPRLPLEAPDDIPREILPEGDVLLPDTSNLISDAENSPAKRRRPAKAK
jgi:hypothetical protein